MQLGPNVHLSPYLPHKYYPFSQPKWRRTVRWPIRKERKVTNQNVLVVGGSAGIGRAITHQLVEAGQKVWVWARHPRDIAQGEAVSFRAVDVTSGNLPVDSLPERLDALVYCPGSIDLRPFRSLRPEHFLEAFELNVLGAVRCLQAAERPLKQSDNASVVLFSTVAVQRGMPFHTAIAAAKGGVEGLVRSLAAEWAPRIRVNAIAPSLTDTPLADRLLAGEEKRKAAAERHPLRRYGRAEEVAALAVFLLSPAAAFMTGQIIGMDGGLSAI